MQHVIYVCTVQSAIKILCVCMCIAVNITGVSDQGGLRHSDQLSVIPFLQKPCQLWRSISIPDYCEHSSVLQYDGTHLSEQNRC